MDNLPVLAIGKGIRGGNFPSLLLLLLLSVGTVFVSDLAVRHEGFSCISLASLTSLTLKCDSCTYTLGISLTVALVGVGGKSCRSRLRLHLLETLEIVLRAMLRGARTL